MSPQTEATLKQLDSGGWFTKTGTTHGISLPEKVVLLRSWEEAIDQCRSVEWENLCLEAQNQYRMRLLERNRERYRQWNDTVDLLKPVVSSFVQRKIETVVVEYGLPREFEDTVQWDVLGICLEAEFADVYPPGFFASNGYWYSRGHFPCGWEGTFPEGKLVIY